LIQRRRQINFASPAEIGHEGAVRIGPSNVSNLALTGRSLIQASRQHPTHSGLRGRQID
jgi:hypothetical protein